MDIDIKYLGTEGLELYKTYTSWVRDPTIKELEDKEDKIEENKETLSAL